MQMEIINLQLHFAFRLMYIACISLSSLYGNVHGRTQGINL